MRRFAAGVVVLLAAACAPSSIARPTVTPTTPPAPVDSQAVAPPATIAPTPLVVLPAGLPAVCATKPLPTGPVIDVCASTTGVARTVTARSIMVQPDYGLEQILGLVDLTLHAGQIRVDLAPGVAVPDAGAHLSVTGPLTRLPDGARVLTAYVAVTLPNQPPSVPAGVLAARAVWDAARASWPLIPPAIIGEGDVTGTAAAALYPDGIAHVQVRTGVVPDAHTIWHEAGHIYHAAVLRSHGHAATLFTPEDEVGLAYWSARRLPGSWAQSLATGVWATTGFEILAETFAAVNTGDSELASTSGVPLDRDAMRSFFRNLSP